MLFLLDFDFLVLLVVEVGLAGVFSDVVESAISILLASGFFSTALLVLSLVSTGKEDGSLVGMVALIVSSSSVLLVVFNVTTMAGVLLTTFRLIQIQVRKNLLEWYMPILTHQDLPYPAPRCLQLYDGSQPLYQTPSHHTTNLVYFICVFCTKFCNDSMHFYLLAHHYVKDITGILRFSNSTTVTALLTAVPLLDITIPSHPAS